MGGGSGNRQQEHSLPQHRLRMFLKPLLLRKLPLPQRAQWDRDSSAQQSIGPKKGAVARRQPHLRRGTAQTTLAATQVEGIFLEIVDHLVAMSSLGTSVDLPAFQREGHLFCSFTRLAKTRNNVHAAVQSERSLLFAAGGDAKRMSKAPELERGGGGPQNLAGGVPPRCFKHFMTTSPPLSKPCSRRDFLLERYAHVQVKRALTGADILQMM